MDKKALTISSLVMTFAALLFLGEVHRNLNASSENEKIAKFWKEKVAREQLKKLIAMGRFADFKQDVALLIPGQIDQMKVDSEKQKLRNLASVIPHEGTQEVTLSQPAEQMLSEGKEDIRQRNFDKGIKKLEKLIAKYPDSYHIIEAHYLIVEAYSQQEKNLDVISWVDKMVELFPENRFTGYGLLKAGGLYEMDGRFEDALRVYKTIVSVYEDKNLVKEARHAVEKLEL